MFFRFFFSLFCCHISSQLIAGNHKDIFEKTEDGVIVYPNTSLAGGAKAVRLKVITESIIRVTASPTDTFADFKSLITIYTRKPGVKWDIVNSADKDQIILRTIALTATVEVSTGAVAFSDSLGNCILSEKKIGGRKLDPAVFDGEPLYHIKQCFQTGSDDAYYGLGQHQDDVYDYKGHQTVLFQNNTEVAVPFLVSRKNYGILWDNYSISHIGDTRPYLPLSAFKLFDKNGDAGWLTASYSNDKNNPEQIAFEEPSSNINYEYLGDSKLYLPSSFDALRGLVKWNGSIASGIEGLHTFKFTYGGGTLRFG